MNAGAYGQEIGTVVETVRVARAGKVQAIPGNEVQWNYRHTSFREGELLLGATLLLQPGDPKEIAASPLRGHGKYVTGLHPVCGRLGPRHRRHQLGSVCLAGDVVGAYRSSGLPKLRDPSAALP